MPPSAAEHPVVRAALLEYLRNHVSSRGDRQEVYLRSNADDFCGVSYRISYQRHDTQAATIAVRSSWPMDLELDFYTDDTQRNWLRAVCMDGPSHVTLTPTSSSSAILSWTLRPDEEETEDALRIISWLSRLRFEVLSVGLRRDIQHILAGEPTAPQLHFVHPKFPVVSVSAAESLTVVLPVPSHNKADEPFLRAVLAAMTTGGPGKAQADAPQCTHRETVPEAAQAFPQAVAQGRLGFLLFHFQAAHMQSAQLESFLERIVMLPDTLQRRITSCKLLVRTMVRRRLCHMREDLLPAQARAADAAGSGRLSNLPAT